MRILSLFLTSLFLAQAGSVSARTVTVAGSDFLPESLVEALAAFAESRDDTLEVGMNGSLLAFRDFNRGEADLILVAIPDRSAEDFGFPVVPLGFQIGTLVVNRKNPIDEITKPQLGGIFGAPTENTITQWSELGLGGAWERRIIQAGYADPPKNPVVAMFSAYFLDNEPIRAAIPNYETSFRLESYVSNNDNAIGLLGGLPLGPDLKTIRIASSDDGISFGPTMENVNYGDYPLTLAYYVCVPRSQQRLLTPYVEFLLSDEIADLLETEGFFPVIRSRRLQLASAFPPE